MKCFYHRQDLDGFCSGAIVKLKHPEAELIGINYNEPFPWETIEPGELVYMVDFSLSPFSDMVRLNRLTDLVWIDHHKSALLERDAYYTAEDVIIYSDEEFTGLQENGQAGCELTWRWCFGPVSLPPRAVFLLGRYDVWDHHNHPGALEFQYGMRALECDPNNIQFWTDMFTDAVLVESVVQRGGDLLAFEQRNNAIYAGAYAFDADLDGLRCIAINKGCCNSLLFDTVYDPSQHDAMLSFCRGKHGGWKISLYSAKPEIDVSVIAKSFGGGGIRGLQGFR